MVNYVNEQAFFEWYERVTGSTPKEPATLLNDVFNTYANYQKSEYTIPANKSISGNVETYPFRFENLGCCGASTYYIYF